MQIQNQQFKEIDDKVKAAKQYSYRLTSMTDEEKNVMLYAIADAIEAGVDEILNANKEDLAKYKKGDETFKDRLMLNEKRIKAIANGVREVAKLESPIGKVTKEWTTESGLKIQKVRAPLGLIAVVYEARPNVTADVIALGIKSSNGVILKGGSDAYYSNCKIFEIIKNAITKFTYYSDFIQMIDSRDRPAFMHMLSLDEYIDVIIPRGGEKLKKLILENSKIPVIASAGGNCHLYVDVDGNIEWAKSILNNAKMQRPSVCNAVEQLVINRDKLDCLPFILEDLIEKGCIIKGDVEACEACSSVIECKPDEYYEEHLDYYLTIKTVGGIAEAIDFINEHSTHHSEAIISSNKESIELFLNQIDSACVYVNASTRFTDGFEFGFGAEIGISTQKLHARGPMGIEQLTSEKYLISGEGTIREL